jgi:hypothetical protein
MTPVRALYILIILTVVCFVVMVLLAYSARAHSSINPANNHVQIYDPVCCSSTDCEPIPYESVWQEDDGWHVQYISKRGFKVRAVVPFGKEKLSRDGRMHGCAIPNYFRCLYITLGL